MTMYEIRDEYFDWLINLVSDNGRFANRSYLCLLKQLDMTPFIFSVARDANRMSDGIDLRYRFGYERNYADSIIHEYLDIYECSCLEVLIGLALRIEENIMSDGEVGDRTAEWFWEMLSNIKLNRQFDGNCSEKIVDSALTIWLEREYSYDGIGNIFRVRYPAKDMRDTEIWYQAMWYLDEILYNT